MMIPRAAVMMIPEGFEGDGMDGMDVNVVGWRVVGWVVESEVRPRRS